MKKILVAALTAVIASMANIIPAHSLDLKNSFINPPDSVRVACYWYWLDGNISKEGVIKDLEAMKKARITRAFIGQIGECSQEGPVRIFSDEWYDILRSAMKRASELDIEIGMFNCPGWSQAGGPWISPDESMRYMATTISETTGGDVRMALPRKPGEWRDVKVLAYPSLGRRIEIQAEPFGASGQEEITIALPEDMKARGLRIVPAGIGVDGKVEVLAKKCKTATFIREIGFNRSNAAPDVGFEPWAPVAVTLPAITADSITLRFCNVPSGQVVKAIEISESPVAERYPEKSLAKLFQQPLPYWADYMWDTAPDAGNEFCVSPDKVIDLTAYLHGDTLSVLLPSGKWTIARIGSLPTGSVNGPAPREGRGPEVDKLSPAHLAKHYDAYIGDLLRRIPAEERRSWKFIVADSYERGAQNYTDDFFEDFAERYGYDPTPYLPALSGAVVASQDVTDRFLWDLRRMVADRLAYDHIGAMGQLAHADGLKTWLEPYGHWGFPGEFLLYGGQADEIGGEFWDFGELGNIENRAAASSAHIYGKDKVWAESFTTGLPPFTHYPGMLKQRGDRFFAEGINATLLHVYIQQPQDSLLPGMNAWFGNEFNRNNTWFSQMDLFTDYLRRCNFMLRQGLNVADVAYFIGEDAPKMTGAKNASSVSPGPLGTDIPAGYQFDYINADVLLRDAFVKDGKITLPHGTQYSILVLPDQATMRPEVLRKIGELVNQGAVILGEAPSHSPSLQDYPYCDEAITSLASRLWGSDSDAKYIKYGKGLICRNVTLSQALECIGCLPDFIAENSSRIDFCHRTLPDGKEIYFLTNQSDSEVNDIVKFRVKGKAPLWWEPVTKETRPLKSYAMADDGTMRIPLKLLNGQSAFVVFDPDAQYAPTASASVSANFPNDLQLAEIEGPWDITFTGPVAAPSPIRVTNLIDWTSHPDDDVKYYSGSATYTTAFKAAKPASGRLWLDLGNVGVMAKVKVNGKDCGGVWTAPFRVDVTDFIGEGENVLDIEVVNNWINRLVGDLRSPESQRHTAATYNPYNADTGLQTSGLLGPVRLINTPY